MQSSFGSPGTRAPKDCWEEVTITLAENPLTGSPNIEVEVLAETKDTVTEKIVAWLNVEGKCVCAANPTDYYYHNPTSCTLGLWEGDFKAVIYKEADGHCPNSMGSCEGSYGPLVVKKEFEREFNRGDDVQRVGNDGCNSFFRQQNRVGKALFFNLRRQLDYLKPLKCKESKDEIGKVTAALMGNIDPFDR